MSLGPALASSSGCDWSRPGTQVGRLVPPQPGEDRVHRRVATAVQASGTWLKIRTLSVSAVCQFRLDIQVQQPGHPLPHLLYPLAGGCLQVRLAFLLVLEGEELADLLLPGLAPLGAGTRSSG